MDFVENQETQRVMALPDQALPLVVYEAHLTELHPIRLMLRKLCNPA